MERVTKEDFNEKRQMIFGIGVIAVLVVLFAWNFSQGRSNNSANQVTNPMPSTSNEGQTTASSSLQTDTDLTRETDILVVYFSRTEGVWNGPLEIGNTKRLGNFIQESTNSDVYEIIPEEDYPVEYEDTADLAREEQRADVRPSIANPLPDLSEYETIFIGAPVWWSEYPMIVRTFLDAEQEELSNKTLVPFTTHEGSGLGNTQRQLESQFSNATVLDGFTVRGDDAIDAQEDINDWLIEIGVIN